ncbi:MAG: hypothetical protein RLZZ165_1187 [Bacteroidota bacterium]
MCRTRGGSGIAAYPVHVAYTVAKETLPSGNAKLNATFHLQRQLDLQWTGIYLAPDIVPQGRIASRYAIDAGVRKGIQDGKGELFLNGSDLLNTMRIRKSLRADTFRFYTSDLYETQVFRLGYSYKF